MEREPLVILLVEDNLDHAELIQRCLRDHHFPCDIHHVIDGESALDYMFRRKSFSDPASSPCPNLILLDLRLPKVDGLEVLKTIKAAEDLRRIPVVVLTTSDSEMDLNLAYLHYANSYLVKPVDFDKFISLMHDLGLYWLFDNRNV